jgi:single-stranded DNA-binding protein
MHLNKVIVIGRVGTRGLKLTRDEHATPTCAFTLEIDESGRGDKVYTQWILVEIISKFVEDVAEHLEPGDEVIIDGKLKYRATVDKMIGQA